MLTLNDLLPFIGVRRVGFAMSRIASSKVALAPGPLEHWTSPIIASGRIYVAGDGRVYAFTL